MSVTPACPESSGSRLSSVRRTPMRRWPGSVHGWRGAGLCGGLAASARSATSASRLRRTRSGPARAGAAAAPAAAGGVAVGLRLCAGLRAERGAVLRRPWCGAIGWDRRITREHLVDSLVGAAERARERGADLDHPLGEFLGREDRKSVV